MAQPDHNLCGVPVTMVTHDFPKQCPSDENPGCSGRTSAQWLAAMDLKTSSDELEQLAANAPIAFLEQLAGHPNAPESLLRQLACHPHHDVRSAIADNPNTPSELIQALCNDQNPDVRFCIAENHNIKPDTLKLLVTDDNPYVAERAKKTMRRLKSKEGIMAGADHDSKSVSEQGDSTGRTENKRLKILAIEDNPADVKLLKKLLAEGPFELKSQDRVSTGLENLAKESFDLILLDLSLPDAQGIETFYQVHCQVPNMPIVVLTGLEDELVGRKAVQAGAQDYLVKGQVLPGLLGRSINYAVERYRTETKMKKLNESLERRVIQLASANQELDKLAQALSLSSEQALQAVNFKSEFVANISHELRTPLSAVLGITELVLSGGTTYSYEEMKGFIDIIDQSARSQLSLLNEILDLSKIEAGKVKLENVDFCPVTLVEDIAQLFAAQAAKKGVSLITYIDAGLQPLLQGDATRLREILINLTNNAIKFTAQGEVLLQATKESEDEGCVTARFSVTDSGIGLSEEDNKHLFEPFTQSGVFRQYGGTGLGLSICKRLVDLMGGQIGAKSKQGKGSSFWFSVRLRRESDSKPGGGNKDSPLHALLSSYWPNIRVLVVDDNSTARAIIQRYVQSAGWRSNGTAANAEEAISMLHQANTNNDAYSIAVIDLESSSPNSFELASAIQQDPAISNTRLIFLTGIDQRRKGEQAWAAGFSAYLTKPIKQWNLLDCIAELMGNPAGDAIPVESTTSTPQPLVPAGKEVRVLVAEDSPVMRLALVKQLEKLGVKVDAVTNGREAVASVAKENYALILMDCQMLDMTGLEATRMIRKLFAHHTPIIAITGEESEAACLEAGMDQYFQKPVSAQQLRDIVVRWALAGAKLE